MIEISKKLHILIANCSLKGMCVYIFGLIAVISFFCGLSPPDFFVGFLADLQQLHCCLLQHLAFLECSASQQSIKHLMCLVVVLQLFHHCFPVVVLQQALKMRANLKGQINLISFLADAQTFLLQDFLQTLFLIFPQKLRNLLDVLLYGIIAIFQENVPYFFPIFSILYPILKVQHRVNKILQSLDLQFFKAIGQILETEQLIKFWLDVSSIKLLCIVQRNRIRQVYIFKYKLSQISSKEQADYNDSKIPCLELKPIKVPTLQGFFVQKNCYLQELFPFYALFELQQVCTNK